LQTPRIIEKAVEHKFQEVPEAQAYLDQHESKLKTLIKKENIRLPRRIGGQDDE